MFSIIVLLGYGIGCLIKELLKKKADEPDISAHANQMEAIK